MMAAINYLHDLLYGLLTCDLSSALVIIFLSILGAGFFVFYSARASRDKQRETTPPVSLGTTISTKEWKEYKFGPDVKAPLDHSVAPAEKASQIIGKRPPLALNTTVSSTSIDPYTAVSPNSSSFSRRASITSAISKGFGLLEGSRRGSVVPAAPPQAFPTGFTPKTTAEVKALGLYPDYEKLSGVPWPRPYEGYVLENALPRPYRPFRWAYHQTMSLAKMEIDWWLEIESTYAARVAQRMKLWKDHGDRIVAYLPGEDVALACRELMEITVTWLTKRYPNLFMLVEDDGSTVEGHDGPTVPGGKVFINIPLGTRTPLDRGTIHPLEVLIQNVPEDFAITLPREHMPIGFTSPVIQYVFVAGTICSSIGWTIKDKLGLSLHDIHHTTGKVPDYAAKMSMSMDRFFSKNIPPHKPIQRGSWSLEIGQPLFMPADHPHLTEARSFQDPDLSVDDVHLRVDWQTLRRLPLCGAVLFNYKAVFTALKDLREEPYIPALMSKVIKEGNKEIMTYKGTWHVEHKVLPALDAWAKEQVEKGLVKEDWEVATLEEAPFYPGWESVWHAKQGF